MACPKNPLPRISPLIRSLALKTFVLDELLDRECVLLSSVGVLGTFSKPGLFALL